MKATAMKKLLLLIATLFTLTAKAQTSVYHPFPDSNAMWNINFYVWSGVCEWEQRYSYVFSGDTLINSTSYHKLWTPAVETVFNFSTCLPFNNPGYKGCIRQDTSLRKVFIIPPSDTVEQLLYDFNLQVNDSLKGFLVHSGYGPVIINIDSILINGNYRNRWTWQWDFGDTACIIEGIGSTLGLLEDAMQNFDAPSTDMICFHQNGQTIYPNSISQCNLIDKVKNISKQNSTVNISPNPFHSSVLVQVSSEFANAKLNIYNSVGLLVWDERISNQNIIVLNRNELHNGIYFLQLINASGQMINEKLIAE